MKKGCLVFLSIIGVVLIGFIVLVIVLANTIGKDVLPEKSDNPTIQLIIDETNMTLENATTTYTAFNSICNSKSNLYAITYDETLDDLAIEGCKGYRLKTDFSNNAILYTLNGKIHSIRYADFDYYINGEIQGYIYDTSGNYIATIPY